MRIAIVLLLSAAAAVDRAAAEGPYFVTYSHRMEEPGNLEIASTTFTGRPRGGSRFVNSLLELEYGATAWWTTEFYLHGQATAGQGGLFTGYRWENRFRMLPGEHWINPVLYVEWAHVNGADKSMREVVGFDGDREFAEPNRDTRREVKREIEAKLILSSNFRGWNISENFIAEKNLAHEPFEFGYAAGVSRPLALRASPDPCNFCRENFSAGAEVYGGLGTHDEFGFRGGTAHYVAPTLEWRMSNGTALRISPTFGVCGPSSGFLLRFGASYEIAGAGRAVRRLFSASGRRP